jgi:hypothetical protein
MAWGTSGKFEISKTFKDYHKMLHALGNAVSQKIYFKTFPAHVYIN